MKFYAGIGSRETPENVCMLMTHIAIRLYLKKYTCRTGGAAQADTAFEVGASPEVEVYLPWAGFNGRRGGIVIGDDIWLRDIAIDHYPGQFTSLPGSVKKLMTRNSAQILGRGIGEPISEFVICWTPYGKGGGGTGQALRVAATYNVPVYDLALPEAREKVKEMCR